MPQHFPDENVFDNVFAKCRMCEVTLFRCHVASVIVSDRDSGHALVQPTLRQSWLLHIRNASLFSWKSETASSHIQAFPAETRNCKKLSSFCGGLK